MRNEKDMGDKIIQSREADREAERVAKKAVGKCRPKRCKTGDIIRLYAFPGVFTVEGPATKSTYGADGIIVRKGRNGFVASEKSIVEVNGVPCPLLSGPIAAPASDYPHKPQFDYDDGPQSLGQDALRIWNENRCGDHLWTGERELPPE